MADRYWMMKWSYGYCGTDSEERVDACSELGMSPEEVRDAPQGYVEAELNEACWQMAIERVDAGVTPCD